MMDWRTVQGVNLPSEIREGRGREEGGRQELQTVINILLFFSELLQELWKLTVSPRQSDQVQSEPDLTRPDPT